MGEESPKVRRRHAAKVRRLERPAAILLEEIDQAMGSRHIGTHRVPGAAAIMLEIGGPARRERANGRVQFRLGSVSHRRIITARLRPRNISNSDP